MILSASNNLPYQWLGRESRCETVYWIIYTIRSRNS